MATAAFEMVPEKQELEEIKEPATPEAIPSTKEAIMESASQKRSGLLSRIIHNRLVDFATNKLPIPVLDFGKSLIEAAVSKTLSGKKLTGFDRALWFTMSGLILVSYAMMMSEKFTGVDLTKEGVAVRTVPMILAAIADYRLWEDKIKMFISTRPELAEFVTNLYDQLKFWDSETISLNLSSIAYNLTQE